MIPIQIGIAKDLRSQGGLNNFVRYQPVARANFVDADC